MPGVEHSVVEVPPRDDVAVVTVLLLLLLPLLTEIFCWDTFSAGRHFLLAGL